MGKKAFYSALILREFYFSNNLSCNDLSVRINKSLPFTTSLLNELINEGYVTESGFAPSTGGRRPAMFTIKPDTIYILSVAMDQLVTHISLMNIQNKHVGEVEKFELDLRNNPRALFILGEKIEEVIL